MWRPLLIAIPFVSACVSISSSTGLTKTLTKHRTSVETVAESLVYNATPDIRDSTLVLSLRSEETCRTSVFPVLHEVDGTTRVINKDCGTPGSPSRVCDIHPAYWGVLGGIVVGLGSLVYAEADRIGTQPTASGEKATPDDVRTMGLVVAGIGVPLLVVAAVDAIRLHDTTKDLGEVDGEPEVTTAPCHDRTIANEGLVLVADGLDWRATAKTDSRGLARFPLHDLPERAFETEDGEMHLTLGISGSASVRVSLPKDETAALLDALASDTTSRVAIDRAAGKVATDAKISQARQALVVCQAHVDQADLKSASDCWNDHSDEWAVLRAAGGRANADRMSVDVPICLASATAVLAATSACVATRETSDDDLIAKATCLAEYEKLEIGPSCGPLDMKVPAERLARLDLAKVKARVDVKAAPLVARREKHLALPGWEDLLVGDAPPTDTLQKCSKQDTGGGKFVTVCKGCRSAKLPTPCVEIMVGNPDPKEVSVVTVILPEDETDATRVIADLKRVWGRATSSQRNQALDVDCWDGAHESIQLMTSYYDLSKVNMRDPKARVPRAQHPRRVVAITKQMPGGSCSP